MQHQPAGRGLRGLVARLNLRGAAVVGHSMGALAVYSYVGRFGCPDLPALAVMDMSPKPLSDASCLSGALSVDFAPDTWLGGGGERGARRRAAGNARERAGLLAFSVFS